MSTPSTLVNVHYGQLCTVRVARFEVLDMGGPVPLLAVTFHVQANKTRAYRTFDIKMDHDVSKPAHVLVKEAWATLTGQALSGAAQGQPSALQQSVMSHILDFVKAETQKVGLNLTLDVI